MHCFKPLHLLLTAAIALISSAIYNGNASLDGNGTAQQVGNHTAVLADSDQVALLLNVNARILDDSNFKL